MIKIIILISLIIIFIFSLVVKILSLSSMNNRISPNVIDVYDEKTYKKWMAYHKENSIVSIVQIILIFIIDFILIEFDVFSIFSNKININYYSQGLIALVVYLIPHIIIDIIFNYIYSMVIEQKYGFNKSTNKTFLIDQLKEVLISFCLIAGLLMLFILIHTNLKDWTILLFILIMIVIVILMMTLYPVFSKIFNQFTPLEDGELKEKLTSLLKKYGYHIKEIKVMDASKRTTKSNAYFSGLGKTKTIVLYDNLIKNMTNDEICAVFAHELGHGIHHDTLKNSIYSFAIVALIVLFAWLLVKYDFIYKDFGFDYINYGFALYILLTIIIPFISPLLGLLQNHLSRKAEYRADEQAVLDGYGMDLIHALKKISRSNFSNLAPNKIVVKLTYSHPCLSDRINAINEKNIMTNNKYEKNIINE